MINELIKFANDLDERGLKEEADVLDGIIQNLKGQGRPQVDDPSNVIDNLEDIFASIDEAFELLKANADNYKGYVDNKNIDKFFQYSFNKVKEANTPLAKLRLLRNFATLVKKSKGIIK